MSAAEGASPAERLAAIVGAEHVAVPAATDVAGTPAAVAVTPGTIEEAARVLDAARAAGAAIVPWGGGTQQRIGAPPARADVVLHTGRLAGLLEWEPADLTASLGAGMTLAAVQAHLATRGQQLPIDAPRPDRATLGGLVATNTAGPRRWRYGGWRDLIIGMRMALADGTVIKSGGQVVKNVQGYDLAKLFVGSLGTLGVIGQVNVRLVPLPAARRLAVARGDLPSAAAFLEAVAAAPLRVSTVDLLDEAAAAACGLAGDGWAGLVLSEGTRAEVDGAAVSLARLATASAVRLDAVEGNALDPVMGAWMDLGRTDDLASNEAVLTVGALPSAVAAVMDDLARVMDGFGLVGRRWARAGNGVVYARVRASGRDGAVLPAAQADLLARRPATMLAAGSAAVAQAARPWGAEPHGLAVMRAIKRRFDPAGVLQPGRFVGGI
jgi:glycolate oxidase FAD binding subunit